jgi:hypothetical protein
VKALAILALAVLFQTAPAAADDGDPCANAVVDPIVTPVRDVELDAQRAACVRQELSARVLGHALVDTPGFHGVLGGDLALGARLAFAQRFEASAQLRVVDFAFVQNAVNKVTHTGFGPLVLGAAATDWIGSGARGGVVAQLELPFTRDDMDTLHASAQLSTVLTGQLAPALVLHARLGAHGMHAESEAGSMHRLALRAGSDLAWQVRRSLVLQAGADISAGWQRGLDYVLARAGVHWQLSRSDWRLRAGLGMPFGGSERTNAILDLAVVHGL